MLYLDPADPSGDFNKRAEMTDAHPVRRARGVQSRTEMIGILLI
jgi:hypothetical protein